MTQRLWRVKLPPGVRHAVSGVRQRRAARSSARDFQISEGELVFERELVQQKLGARAWLMGFWGIGTYKRNDEVDVRYELDGRPMVAQGLEVIPPEG